MERIKTGLCIVASVLAASCGSDDLVTRAVVETSAIADLRCRCPESGTTQQCLEEARLRVPSEARQDCYRRAVRAFPDVEASLSCIVDAEASARSCFAAASEDCATAVAANEVCGRRLNEQFAACPERSTEGAAAYLDCERGP